MQKPRRILDTSYHVQLITDQLVPFKIPNPPARNIFSTSSYHSRFLTYQLVPYI